MMEYTQLGRTGLKVSRLALGTMNFGPRTSEEDSHRVMDRAIEHGINVFDTANVYGWKVGEGWTEQIVGRWIKASGKRDQIVLATKLYGKMSDWPNESLLSAKHIRLACDGSLKRLHTEYLDLFQFHHIDRNTPWEEIWEACETLVRQGKVIYFGSSNFAGWHLAHAQGIAKARNFMGLVSEQSLYNLTARTIEMEVIPACVELGLGLFPWSPLGGGMLGGTAEAGGRRETDQIKESTAKHRGQLDAWEGLCRELGERPADVALAWLLHQKAVTAPIIGPRTVQQLDGSLRALEIALGDETRRRIDEIFPGYKTAPEHYAW